MCKEKSEHQSKNSSSFAVLKWPHCFYFRLHFSHSYNSHLKKKTKKKQRSRCANTNGNLSSSCLLFMSGKANLVDSDDDDDHQADDILNHSVVHLNFDTKIEVGVFLFFLNSFATCCNYRIELPMHLFFLPLLFNDKKKAATKRKRMKIKMHYSP